MNIAWHGEVADRSGMRVPSAAATASQLFLSKSPPFLQFLAQEPQLKAQQSNPLEILLKLQSKSRLRFQPNPPLWNQPCLQTSPQSSAQIMKIILFRVIQPQLVCGLENMRLVAEMHARILKLLGTVPRSVACAAKMTALIKSVQIMPAIQKDVVGSRRRPIDRAGTARV